MSQWRDTLHMLENATGGWVTTHDIYDELDIKNPSQRIDDIERLTGRQVEREQIVIRGKRATRYRLHAHVGERVTSDAQAPVTVKGAPGLEAAAPPESSGALFDMPAERSTPSHWKAA